MSMIEGPTHSWLKVSTTRFHIAGMSHIEGASFQDGDNIYLEEDCDAPVFIDKYQKATGEKIEILKNTLKSRKGSDEK